MHLRSVHVSDPASMPASRPSMPPSKTYNSIRSRSSKSYIRHRLHRVRSCPIPRSKSSNASSSRLTGRAATGSSLRVTAACSWTSSEPATSSSWYVTCWGEVELEPADLASERTTSPLQIGHVRRRVVSQGVLLRPYVSGSSSRCQSYRKILTCTRREIRDRMVDS